MIEYTLHSRMRRAMTCVYCDPKSKMTICSGMIDSNPEIDFPGNELFACRARVWREKSVRILPGEKDFHLRRSPLKLGDAGNTTRPRGPPSEMDAGARDARGLAAVSGQAVQYRRPALHLGRETNPGASGRPLWFQCGMGLSRIPHVPRHGKSAAGLLLYCAGSGNSRLGRSWIAFCVFTAGNCRDSRNVPAGAEALPFARAGVADHLVHAGVFGFGHDGNGRHADARVLDLGAGALDRGNGTKNLRAADLVGRARVLRHRNQILRGMPGAAAGGARIDFQSARWPLDASAPASPRDGLHLPACDFVALWQRTLWRGGTLCFVRKGALRIFQSIGRIDWTDVYGWVCGDSCLFCAAALAAVHNGYIHRNDFGDCVLFPREQCAAKISVDPGAIP